MARGPDSSRSGFTLVEMMVSVTLALIISGTVLVAFIQGRDVSMQTYQKAEAIHNAQVILDYLETDLQSACLEVEQLFLGVHDASKGGLDNNNDGAFDEDLDKACSSDPDAFKPADHDPVDFINVTGQERHGLEFITSSLYGASDVGSVHVLYYVTRDAETMRIGPAGVNYEVGRLIRHMEPRDAAPVAACIGAAAPGIDEVADTLAYGVTQFSLRYYCNGQWFDGWDSSDPGNDIQFRNLPQVVEVTLRLVDVKARLDKVEHRNPLVITRLIDLSPRRD